MTEILPARAGVGELSLLVPTLVDLSREGRRIVWIDPPHIPYPPALSTAGIALTCALFVCAGAGRERLWAAEQCLRSGACGAVLLWPKECDTLSLRRLQLAAEKGGSLGFLFRPERAAALPSPAALRLRLISTPGGVVVEVLKGRGSVGRRAEVRLAS